MTLTTKGQPRLEIKRKADAIRGRELIRQERQDKRDFKSLQDGGNKPKPPKLKLGPLLRS